MRMVWWYPFTSSATTCLLTSFHLSYFLSFFLQFYTFFQEVEILYPKKYIRFRKTYIQTIEEKRNKWWYFHRSTTLRTPLSPMRRASLPSSLPLFFKADRPVKPGNMLMVYVWTWSESPELTYKRELFTPMNNIYPHNFSSR